MAAPPGRLKVPRRRVDAAVVASSVVIPFLLLGVAAASGWYLLPGDDLTQNAPLRALVGSDVAAGHLPVWNPYIWSGTPLLGGFNAGAIYPATLLFAALGTRVGWVVAEGSVFAVAASGMYLFLRSVGLRPAAAGLGAGAWSYAGFIPAQLAHIGLVQGVAWQGWLLLAIDRLADETAGHRAGWVGLLGLGGGLVVLAGDPRAISNVAVVSGAYAVWCLARSRARLRLLGRLAAGCVLAGAVGAGQILAGLPLQASSQRSQLALSGFAAGSVHYSQLLLLAVPFLLGGFGTMGLPGYVGDFNLPELSGYVGTVVLAGALAAVGAAFAGRRPGRRMTWPPGRRGQVGLWAAVAVVGGVLALGGNTPLAHLLHHVPAYGNERLQSRNLGVVDVALVVLFAVGADRYLTREGRPSRPATAAGLVVPLAVLGTALFATFAPGTLARVLFSGSPPLPRNWPFVVASVVLAAGTAWLIVGAPGVGRRGRRLALVGLVAADCTFFTANAAYGWLRASGLPPAGTTAAAIRSMLPVGARYAVYDPTIDYPGYNQSSDALAPVPDLNLFARLPSVQGYGSIVAGAYDGATGTHQAGGLLPAMLAQPLADRLTLGLVLADPPDLPDLLPYLRQPRWSPAGVVSGLVAFRNNDPLPSSWLETDGAGPAPAGARTGGTVATGPVGPGGGQTVTVTTTAPARLVRSQVWAPGWEAVLDGRNGAHRTVATEEDGLLQAARLPPGTWRVTFRYRSVRTLVGLVVSAVAASAALVVVSGSAAAAGRRRRRRATPSMS
ncbi:MAG TPA: hypothetical protein VFH45_05155 [Acidimicrobiales bacterium]|nr:hypothetical protein [Acidimicrobiales bacterium]